MQPLQHCSAFVEQGPDGLDPLDRAAGSLGQELELDRVRSFDWRMNACTELPISGCFIAALPVWRRSSTARALQSFP
jgi:hypothetical protein